MSERESMPYDVVIVGAGPAGLSAAIRLKQMAGETGEEIAVCVLEKGSEVGAHILSGAVFDPRAMDELLPDWREQGCPMAEVPVTENHHWFLTEARQFGLPQTVLPGFMHNEGTYTGSLGNLCRWLAGRAEAMDGVAKGLGKVFWTRRFEPRLYGAAMLKAAPPADQPSA